MMNDKQLNEYLANVQEQITEATEVYDTSRLEILSTLLAVALGGIRAEAKVSGDLAEVEKDLEKIGIIMSDIEDRYFDDFDEVPPDETIH